MEDLPSGIQINYQYPGMLFRIKEVNWNPVYHLPHNFNPVHNVTLQVDEIATNFGRGLRELGLEPKSNVCIFADTKAEW